MSVNPIKKAKLLWALAYLSGRDRKRLSDDELEKVTGNAVRPVNDHEAHHVTQVAAERVLLDLLTPLLEEEDGPAPAAPPKEPMPPDWPMAGEYYVWEPLSPANAHGVQVCVLERPGGVWWVKTLDIGSGGGNNWYAWVTLDDFQNAVRAYRDARLAADPTFDFRAT